MPGTIRLGALLALLAAAVALPGCGSDEVSGEIEPGDATELNNALAGVRAEIEAGCTDLEQARDQAQAFLNQVNELPQEPTGEVKGELQEAALRLRTLVESECTPTESPTTTPSSTTTPPTTTEPTTTEPTTTTESSTPTEEPPAPGNGNGNGPPGGEPPGNGPPDDGGTGGTGGTGSGDDE